MGTSTTAGSPYHTTRSAKASFIASIIRCVRAGPERSTRSSNASACNSTGPCDHVGALHTVHP
jgi:hypothetical protein